MTSTSFKSNFRVDEMFRYFMQDHVHKRRLQNYNKGKKVKGTAGRLNKITKNIQRQNNISKIM